MRDGFVRARASAAAFVLLRMREQFASATMAGTNPAPMNRMPTRLLCVLLLAAVATAQDTALLFQANCAACHLVDRKHVGPSLVEIAGIYRDRQDDFVAWCEAPQVKRQGVLQMPSMAHVGEPNLRKLHGHILEITEGVEEVVVEGDDRFRAAPSMRKRPQVLRIFLPDAGPAAIAVAVDDRWSYCFDAGACRLRYVWTGDFVDGWPVWRANGNALAKIVGDVVYREPAGPLPFAADAERRFLGYRIEQGLPTFRYRIGDVEVRERITVPERAADDPRDGLDRHFELREAPDDLQLRFGKADGVRWTSEHGTFSDDGVFTPAAAHRRAFTVTMEVRS